MFLWFFCGFFVGDVAECSTHFFLVPGRIFFLFFFPHPFSFLPLLSLSFSSPRFFRCLTLEEFLFWLSLSGRLAPPDPSLYPRFPFPFDPSSLILLSLLGSTLLLSLYLFLVASLLAGLLSAVYLYLSA